MAKETKKSGKTKGGNVLAAAGSGAQPVEANVVRQFFELTAEQRQLAASLTFVPAELFQKTQKVSRDVGDAFDAKALSTVAADTELGGARRADEIQNLLARHEQLVEIAEKVDALQQLVSQNLVVTGAALSGHANELNKLGKIYGAKRPQVLKGLKAPLEWSKRHHATGPRAPKQTPPKP